MFTVPDSLVPDDGYGRNISHVWYITTGQTPLKLNILNINRTER